MSKSTNKKSEQKKYPARELPFRRSFGKWKLFEGYMLVDGKPDAKDWVDKRLHLIRNDSNYQLPSIRIRSRADILDEVDRFASSRSPRSEDIGDLYKALMAIWTQGVY